MINTHTHARRVWDKALVNRDQAPQVKGHATHLAPISTHRALPIATLQPHSPPQYTHTHTLQGAREVTSPQYFLHGHSHA